MMKTWTKRAILAGLMLGVIVAAGCARSKKPQTKAAPQDQAGIPVQAAPAQLDKMVEEIPVTGTISALRKADVTAQISGRVVSVTVQEGESVKAGQVVVRLDRTEIDSQVSQARAGVVAARARLGAAQKRAEVVQLGARPEELSMAQSRLEQAEAALREAASNKARKEKLFGEGAVSRQELDVATTAYDTARTNRDSARESLGLMKKGARQEEIEASRKDVQAAEAGLVQAEGMLAQMREMLSHTVITSPVTGIVYERNVEPGEVVSSGGSKPLLRVADLGSVYLEATVPERLAHQVTAGQRVSISLRTAGGGDLEGRVQRLVPVADPQSRDFLVRVSFPNSTSGLRPGTFAQARILVKEHDQVVAIPKDALVNRGSRYVVFLVRGGKAVERPVQVGLTDRTRAEVLSGVSPGESIVIVGAQALKNGDVVKVGTSGGA